MVLNIRFLIKAISKARPVALASLCFFVLYACDSKPESQVYQLEGHTMGTTYHITAVVGPHVVVAESALQMQVDKLLENVNQVMSTYIPDSELSMLNQVEHQQPTIVSQALFDILALSEQISILSDSAFDVTVGPLVNLWGFGPQEREQLQPDDAQLAEVKKRVGFQFIRLDAQRRQVTKFKPVTIDLSAIAKGYGADAIAELFHSLNINDYMIELGGELAVSGHNPAGVLWRIGIEQPTLTQTGVVEAISAEKAGIATSGDYRNYIEIDGQRFSHTIDPHTGKPVTHKLASVTVVAPSAAEADGLATALTVLGPEKAYQLSVNEGLAAFFIMHSGDTFITKASPQFEQYRVKM
ncbi:thiamine biosynthesis lipoprotein [Alteromonadaceae bacterium Bs31]|nr:thiamine biosynthesis lipoprotein [Alteromonadaceae bacterium Bs31]